MQLTMRLFHSSLESSSVYAYNYYYKILLRSYFSFKISVPLMPTGFNTSMQYDSSLDTVVTFQWDPPQGSGPEAIVNSYKISITPRPISHPAFNTISYSTSWNVTLYFNLEYSASITAVNCAGDSHPFTLHGIKFSESTLSFYSIKAIPNRLVVSWALHMYPKLDTRLSFPSLRPPPPPQKKAWVLCTIEALSFMQLTAMPQLPPWTDTY